MRRNFHQSVRDCYVGEDGGKPVGIAAVGKVGRHEARVCGVVGAVAGADIEGELNLAALVEALADFVLEVTAGGGSSGSNESWYGRGQHRVAYSFMKKYKMFNPGELSTPKILRSIFLNGRYIGDPQKD